METIEQGIFLASKIATVADHKNTKTIIQQYQS